MKVLITTGCSFSEPELWPYHLEKRIPNLSYKNYGKSGMGNEYISRTVSHSVTELLKSGMESKEILVMCCWTAFDRLQNSFSEDKLYGIPTNPFRDHDSLFKNKILDSYDLLLNGLEPIISTQNFLKVNNIDFIFFSMFNLFANNLDWQYDIKNKLQIPPKTWNTKRIPVHIYGTKIDNMEYVSTLNENIDWDKWWFCNEKDKVKFGGIAEWVSINDPFNAYTERCWKLKVIPGHPANEGHKTFANNVLSKLVLEKIQ